MRIGEFNYDPDSGRLHGPSGEHQLRPQTTQALQSLLKRPGELVPRDVLVRAIWGDDLVVDYDAGLAAIMRDLRRAFDDDPNRPRYLVTVPKRGYRLIAPVGENRQHSPLLLAFAVLVLFGVGIVIGMQAKRGSPASPELPTIAVLPFDDLSVDTSDDRFRWLLADDAIAHLGPLTPDRIGLVARAPIRQLENALDEAIDRLNATHVVEGSYQMLDDGQWLVRISIFGVADGVIVATLEERVDLTDHPAREALARRLTSVIVGLLPDPQNSAP